MKTPLTETILQQEAASFAELESKVHDPKLYGVTDGKAVGTYFEHKFRNYLEERHDFRLGSSAKGIDFPGLNVDMKVTSHVQPQSSCPFKTASQKIFGLGYSLLVFAYIKSDNEVDQTGQLRILDTIFLDARHTADYQTTTGLQKLVANHANVDDILAFFEERLLPVADMEAVTLAEKVLAQPPCTGYLTISNALQWRLQYRRAITLAGETEGILRLQHHPGGFV